MSNTMRTLIFILSLFAVFIYFYMTSGLTLYVTANIAAPLSYYITNGIAMLGFLVVLYTQSLVRILVNRHFMKQLNVISSFPVKTVRVGDRLSIYVIPGVITILPITRKGFVDGADVATLICLLIFIIIVEILLVLNSRTMKLFITNNGLLIEGIDLRLDIPIPSNFRNASGFFHFNRLQNFLILNNKLVLEQSYDSGVIEFEADAEELRKIKAMLLAKGVVEKRY